MAVQQEIKSHLAKLLATEDIVVEHKKVPSAQFNVRTRVLILPLWEKASRDVYDMLVGHEVGHALFTPDEDWWLEHDVPQQFVNVVEDARIEKLMKRKYMGIAKSFYKGYSELHNQDFFELDGQDIASFNLADRANLYFKIGSLLPLAFSPTEKSIINLINDCETFKDTLSAAEALYNFCKQEQERDSGEKELEAKQDALMDIESSGAGDTDGPDDYTSPISDTDSHASVEDRIDSFDNTPGMDDSGDSLEVQTADALESKLKDLVPVGGMENVYLEIPKVKLENIIASNKEVHEVLDEYWGYEKGLWSEKSVELGYDIDPGFTEVDSHYVKFKRDAKKEVSYLVKEFECRKAASSYARASTSRTGILSTEKLYSYRYNEDLFRKVTTLPEGKNHGLVFILDWSGSMQYVLEDTLKQLYNLIWFCKKVQIPFEVYAFTNEWSRNEVPSVKSERREGVLYVEDAFNLMNLFTSKVNLQTLEHQMINIWRLAASFGRRDGYHIHFSWPQRMILSGTPLNESLISLHQLLPQFQKENGVEKVQCVILTDGEANALPYHKEVQRNWESNPYLGCRNINASTCFLRDRKVGKVYKFGGQWHEFTQILLENLKDNFPMVNFIGIRVLVNRDAKQFIRIHHGEDEKLMTEWRRNKSFTIKKSGYDAYFALSSSALADDSEFDVDDDATKAQIKKAFAKSLKTKKLNKKVLGEFMSLVA
jgi:hypothetical protein